jgi:hypothetical protein
LILFDGFPCNVPRRTSTAKEVQLHPTTKVEGQFNTRSRRTLATQDAGVKEAHGAAPSSLLLLAADPASDGNWYR